MDPSELDLSNKNLSSLSRFPSTLQTLLDLNLSNNELTSLHNINYLPNLTHLDCSHNKLNDIEDVVSLRSLKILLLSHNNLSSLTGLEYLHSLEVLDLSHNALSNADLLTKCTTLRTLDLAHNQLTTLPNLTSLRHLQTLCLFSNSLTSLPTGNLPSSLTSLDLAKTSIDSLTSLNGLASVSSLTSLRLDQTPIFNESLSVGFSLCVFVLFLSPKLTKFNQRFVKERERSLASQLFSGNDGELDSNLLKLLIPSRKSSLYNYLVEVASLQLCSDVSGGNQSIMQSNVDDDVIDGVSSDLITLVSQLQSEINQLKSQSINFNQSNVYSNHDYFDSFIPQIIHLQSIFRGFLVRKRSSYLLKLALKNSRLESRVFELENYVFLYRIRKIQAIWRGYYCRKQLNNVSNFRKFLQNKVKLKNRSAMAIQRAFRYYYYNKKPSLLHSIITLQSVIRGFLVRKRYSNQISNFKLKVKVSLLEKKIEFLMSCI
ncbi:hypothetical protein P9112_007831 [Eukaryota sp. TZLM1-RC]